MSIKEVNFTTVSDGVDTDNKMVRGLEFTVVKGCAVKAEIQAKMEEEGAGYVAGRKCWTSEMVSLN